MVTREAGIPTKPVVWFWTTGKGVLVFATYDYYETQVDGW